MRFLNLRVLRIVMEIDYFFVVGIIELIILHIVEDYYPSLLGLKRFEMDVVCCNIIHCTINIRKSGERTYK
jgi:hypothetical protein